MKSKDENHQIGTYTSSCPVVIDDGETGLTTPVREFRAPSGNIGAVLANAASRGRPRMPDICVMGLSVLDHMRLRGLSGDPICCPNQFDCNP